MPTERSCVAGASCSGPVPSDAPLDLCERHLAVAADWSERQSGVIDVLPAPCRICGSRLGARYRSGWLCAVCEWRVGDVVDDELAPPRIDVVYYLRFADRVKIGTTANPRQRFAAIWHDDLMGFERGGRRLEQRRHEQFADSRLGRTEWFEASDPLLAHIAAVAAGVDDPWDVHSRWCSEALALRG